MLPITLWLKIEAIPFPFNKVSSLLFHRPSALIAIFNYFCFLSLGKLYVCEIVNCHLKNEKFNRNSQQNTVRARNHIFPFKTTFLIYVAVYFSFSCGIREGKGVSSHKVLLHFFCVFALHAICVSINDTIENFWKQEHLYEEWTSRMKT